MIQWRLTRYIREEQTPHRDLLRKLKWVADRFTIQYALLWYIYLTGEASFRKLYKVYRYLSDKVIRENTVRKQLSILERKGLIKKEGDSYIALVDPRDVEDLFDRERSRAGKIGAAIKHMKMASKSLKISPGLSYYTKQVVETAQKLIKEGKRAAALDLITHTLLPLRENAILWLWHQDLFIYYEPKTRQRWRAVKSGEIAKLLKNLGFTPGITILHILGHSEASKIIHRIFQRGPYSWPWARSISYGLKQLGLLQETTNFKIQLKKLGSKIELILWNLYTKEQLCKYEINWKYEPPEPLKSRHYIVATVLGKQHVREEIEINSYSSKWRR